MHDEKPKKEGSQFWWPDVSKPESATASAKATQFVAYWIGVSYLILAYISGSYIEYAIATISVLFGISIWRNFLWVVPIVSSIGLLEAVGKIVLSLSAGKASGLITAGIMLFLSIHGWRGWLALRKQAKHHNSA